MRHPVLRPSSSVRASLVHPIPTEGEALFAQMASYRTSLCYTNMWMRGEAASVSSPHAAAESIDGNIFSTRHPINGPSMKWSTSVGADPSLRSEA